MRLWPFSSPTGSSASGTPLEALQERIGYRFRNPALLGTALTHSSLLQDQPEIGESNQRLEFLGDAVLQLILTEALYGLFPAEREGPLSRRRAALANGAFLTQLAREIGLDACLRLAASEESTGGRTRASSLEDAFEALVGAIFLDADLTAARRVVLALYGDLGARLAVVEQVENPKGRLQEMMQPRYGNNAVRYQVVRVVGEDHAREYEIAVFVQNQQVGSGRGTSKKLAEEAAARAALEQFKETGDRQ
ncbi:ribonuclease III [Opitutus sp. ER46]|uniref:ribonuclease III n=1 Tax=Opitutus sp. ER46 TaxID=2161864 RepID=UPI000D326AA1|nr:ribonuclease III [Opitutus sp. ER46]PTX92664.1 ribonuclease III [Opitutus sp. ER46]